MQNITHMNVLNHPTNMQTIVLKLPLYLQNKWRDTVGRLRNRSIDRSVTFHDLAQFVKNKASSVNDPVFSKEALGQQKPKPNATVFATNVPWNAIQCYMCKQDHDIEQCKEFLAMTLSERRMYLQQNRRCFACFGYNHLSKDCRKKRQCKTCGRKHPTSLHDPYFGRNINNTQESAPSSELNSSADTTVETSSSAMVQSGDSSSIVLQPIVPVKVRQAGSNCVTDTYALLDNGSTGCFITEDLRHQLKAKHEDSMLKLQTLHGSKHVPTSIVQNLEVSDLHHRNTVKLPKCYTRQEIPVDHSQIPKRELFEHFPHLAEVAKEIPPYFEHLSMGLLIGTNCPVALQPLRVIPVKGDGPYAVLHKHGWTVNGPVKISYHGQGGVSCHRVMFQEMESLKECQTISQMFSWTSENKEKWPGQKGYSIEDRQFTDIVKKSCHMEGGHHQLPLPFREEQPHVPNNRNQALHRLSWQTKKMKANKQYHEDYTQFMEKIIGKGYAYEVPPERLNSQQTNVSYLPHHGVYHAKKNKIRVVFDCSAKYQGVSLNDRLLQGPDLTNSLQGVLTRFRVGAIAFIGDIESMFNQVRVPVFQHDFLRFLWWPDGDYTGKLTEYCMAVHIFGATSSPSIANFALRSTAQIAEERGNSEIANVIRRNFYVDDCLKAVDSEEKAAAMIHELKDACAEGGFNLTKFTSNSKEVIKSIPDGEALTTLDLDLDKACNERALGTEWSLDTDTIGFSIQPKEKPSTRRGILSTIASVYDPLGIAAPYVMVAKRLLQDLCKD